jgi:hypothetical protein
MKSDHGEHGKCGIKEKEGIGFSAPNFTSGSRKSDIFWELLCNRNSTRSFSLLSISARGLFKCPVLYAY